MTKAVLTLDKSNNDPNYRRILKDGEYLGFIHYSLTTEHFYFTPEVMEALDIPKRYYSMEEIQFNNLENDMAPVTIDELFEDLIKTGKEIPPKTRVLIPRRVIKTKEKPHKKGLPKAA